MKQRLKILVEISDPRCHGNFKELYRHVLYVDDSLSFDYQSVLSALKLLYPDDGTIFSFIIS